MLDPGIGFAKEAAHGWALLAQLDALDALGFPLLVGVSRKRFLGHLLAGEDGTPRPVEEREDASHAAAALLAETPDPTDDDIDGVMTQNICRCGTYPRIRAAIKRAAGQEAG